MTALVNEHLDSRLRATKDEFMSYLSESITARITEQVKIQLPQILPKEALKTWFQTYGVLLKFPMINMHYGVFLVGDNNVEVMLKHGYGYLREIEVRRADNDLYTFKEGDFPRLCINDIEDMLICWEIQVK
ncbi:hypothetical protein Tco_0188112, partial [Tanacetum coccineum]